MLGDVGWEELLIILVIVALVFGASRVSDLGRSLGRGIREFRSEVSQGEAPATPPTPPALNAGTEERRVGAHVDALAALQVLREQGVLSAEEFEKKKEDVLAAL